MAKKKVKGTSSKSPKLNFKIENPHAGGVDIGSRSNWVSIGLEEEQTKEFGVFTEDHHALCKWLVSKGITSVAMESTGFYWKQLFLMLQSYGIQVYLVNASFTKNIRNRKPSDMADSQWIWKMHTVGLLPASFQPDFFTEELRSYSRLRQRLIQGSARCVNQVQKCLILMNLQLPLVLSDITGKSGKKIIEAIVGGERDGNKLANLADPRVKTDKATIAKALTGFWKDNHLFELKQHWQRYHFYQTQIAQVDEQIEDLLKNRVVQTGQRELVYKSTHKKRKQKNAPNVSIDTYAYQLSDGVDLMQVEGISYSFVLSFLAEVGMDLSSFPTFKHFVSWLCLCPNRKMSGGKVLSSRTQKNKSRLRQEFCRAAVAIGKKKDSALGSFYRRMSFQHDKGVAIVATARKLAIIVYNMVQKGQAYRPESSEQYQLKLRTQKIKHIQRTIAKFDVKEEELGFAFN